MELVAPPLAADSGERLNEAWHDIEKRKLESCRTWPLAAPLRGACFGVERADDGAVQVRLARPEHVLPSAAEVVSNEILKACRRSAQEVEHGLQGEQVGVLGARELVPETLRPSHLGIVARLIVVWLCIENQALDGDDDLDYA